MKISVAFLLLTVSLPAQTTLNEILSQSLKQAVAGLAPVPEADRKEVVAATAELLSKHVTFRPNGSASSVSTVFNSRQNIEWKNLTIKYIKLQNLSEADRLNGLTKRYTAILSCDATRRWDKKKNAWTKWSPTGHMLFPTGINVEWRNGKRSATGGTHLPKFSPGPGPSVTETPPAGKKEDLPPGMSRRK